MEVKRTKVKAAGSFRVFHFGDNYEKWLTAGVGFGIGAVMLLVSGFSAMANTSGYDAYKAALKNTKTVSSLQVCWIA